MATRVLPFRSALVGAVRDAFDGQRHVTVQPMAVAYTRLQGVPMALSHRPVPHGRATSTSHPTCWKCFAKVRWMWKSASVTPACWTVPPTASA